MRLFEGYEEEKRFNIPSALHYITTHQSALAEFLQERVKRADWEFVIREFMGKNPVLLANMLKINYETSEADRKDFVLDELSKEGTFILMLGAKRHGKTATGIDFAEDLHDKDIDVYWFGYNETLQKLYPWIKQTFNISRIENGFVLYDEALQSMLGRDAMTKGVRHRIKNLPTAGHRGVSILWMSQSNRVDAVLRDLIEWVWFKPLFNLGMNIFDTGLKLKNEIKYLLPYKKSDNLLYNTQTEEPYMFSNDLPVNWCEGLSKPYSLIKDRSRALRFWDGLRDGNAFSQKEAGEMLEIVGWTVDELFPEQHVEKVVNKNGHEKTVRDNLIRCKHCKSTDYSIWNTKEGRYKCNDCGRTFRCRK